MRISFRLRNDYQKRYSFGGGILGCPKIQPGIFHRYSGYGGMLYNLVYDKASGNVNSRKNIEHKSFSESRHVCHSLHCERGEYCFSRGELNQRKKVHRIKQKCSDVSDGLERMTRIFDLNFSLAYSKDNNLQQIHPWT